MWRATGDSGTRELLCRPGIEALTTETPLRQVKALTATPLPSVDAVWLLLFTSGSVGLFSRRINDKIETALNSFKSRTSSVLVVLTCVLGNLIAGLRRYTWQSTWSTGRSFMWRHRRSFLQWLLWNLMAMVSVSSSLGVALARSAVLGSFDSGFILWWIRNCQALESWCACYVRIRRISN